MTAAFAFACPTRKASFLGADDIDASNRKRVDKVAHLFDRFFVAGIGNDTVYHAVRFTAVLDHNDTQLRNGGIFRGAHSIPKLCELTLEVLPRISAYLERNLARGVESGKIDASVQKMVATQRGTLVIVDHKKHELASANFGTIFPTQTSYQCELVYWHPDKAYRFGINEPTDVGSVVQRTIDLPFDWCRTQVESARAMVEKEGFVNCVGELGTCYFVKNRHIKSRSAFASLEDALARYYPPILD